MQKMKTDHTSKTVEAELQAHCQMSLSESAKKGKVDTEGTQGQEEVNTVQKMEECNYDEIKVIQENVVTVNERVETRF